MITARLRHGATLLVLTATVTATVAACTGGSGGADPTSAAPSTATRTGSSVPAPTGTPTPSPVGVGPTTAATASSCPYASSAAVAGIMGVRLGRITGLRVGGRVVGCRFYGLQHPNSECDASCLANEHLPGPNQPVTEILTIRYASATDAHNAFVQRATAGTSPTQVDLGGGLTGVCYQHAFDPQDDGKDFACAVNKGTTEVVVRTVDTTGTYSTAALTRTVLGAVRT